MKRLAVGARVMAGAVVLLITILSLLPGELRPHVLPISQLEHVLAYALAAAILGFCLRPQVSLLTLGIALPFFASILELAQLWSPGRDAKFMDAAASALGSTISLVLLYAVMEAWKARQKSGRDQTRSTNPASSGVAVTANEPAD